MAMYRVRWESGSLSEFHFRLLLTRCQADGIYMDKNEVLACDLFQRAIAGHQVATDSLRRNPENLEEWEKISALLSRAQETYGHLRMGSDPAKRQRTDTGGRFSQGARGGGQGGRNPGGRGRDVHAQQGEGSGSQGGAVRDSPHLSPSAKDWYKSHHRCFRCGAEDHPYWRCTADKGKLAHDLPANLRSECDKKL